MKILSTTAILATAALCFASCSKQYNTTTSNSQTGNNGGNGNTGVNSFNWSGTAPLSVKANGTFYHITDVDVVESAGYYYINGEISGNNGMTPVVPANAVPGQIYSMPSPANVSWQFETTQFMVLGASKGKCKVVTNNATTLEGYFWADTKDYTGLHDTTVALTEGYFKVDKP